MILDMSCVKCYGRFDSLTNRMYKIYTELFIKVYKIFQVSKNFDNRRRPEDFLV